MPGVGPPTRAAARALDFATFPARFDTRFAGLLLAALDLPALDLPALDLPALDLPALDLPALAAAADYPGTTVVPTTGWLLSLLALKLTGTRRVSTSTTCSQPSPDHAGAAARRGTAHPTFRSTQDVGWRPAKVDLGHD